MRFSLPQKRSPIEPRRFAVRKLNTSSLLFSPPASQHQPVTSDLVIYEESLLSVRGSSVFSRISYKSLPTELIKKAVREKVNELGVALFKGYLTAMDSARTAFDVSTCIGIGNDISFNSSRREQPVNDTVLFEIELVSSTWNSLDKQSALRFVGDRPFEDIETSLLTAYPLPSSSDSCIRFLNGSGSEIWAIPIACHPFSSVSDKVCDLFSIILFDGIKSDFAQGLADLSPRTKSSSLNFFTLLPISFGPEASANFLLLLNPSSGKNDFIEMVGSHMLIRWGDLYRADVMNTCDYFRSMFGSINRLRLGLQCNGIQKWNDFVELFGESPIEFDDKPSNTSLRRSLLDLLDGLDAP